MTIITLATVLAITPLGQAQPSGLTVSNALEMLGKVMEFVHEHSLNDVSITTLFRGALKGMLEAVGDPYSSYLDPKAYETLMERIDGKYSGVGVMLTFRDGFVTVVSPILGTPADRAGLQPSDRIIAVNGTDVTGMETEAVANMLRGDEGTLVTVTLQRPATGVTFVVKLVREIIDVPSVSYEVIDGFGYIAVTSFSEETAAQFNDAFEILTAEHDIQGLIIDLRFNGGGRVDQGIQIAELFVPEGPISYLVNRQGERRIFHSESSAWGQPLVVLVNEGTASTAEILTVALQDWKVAQVIGTKTFGKSTVQSVVGLWDHGGMRLTTAEYLSPLGRSLKDNPIIPDHYVEQSQLEDVFTPSRVLRIGQTGEDITDLQQVLVRLGFPPGPVDSIFGPMTASAVKAFQNEWDLPVTGEIGPQELMVINRILSSEEDKQLAYAVTVLNEMLRNHQ